MTEPTVTPVPGKPNLLLGRYDMSTLGYDVAEYFVTGTASSYTDVPESAEYTTRIVVWMPSDPARFNGTAIVEWLNVSGGIDVPALWFMAHREIAREGYAVIGVSAQRVGIDGGASMVGDFSLKTLNPERYSSLNHPGDQFSFDIYSQVGRLASEGICGFTPEYVLAVGESQSAMFLTTYVNDVDPHAAVYDGFLVHSRFGPAGSLDGTNMIDESTADSLPAVPFRPDPRVPLMTVIAETDLLGARLPGYYLARVADNDRFRSWEIPGTAHADNYTINVNFIDNGSAALADIVAAYAPTNSLMGVELPHCINFGPQHHYVLQAAIARLHDWVRKGEPAPSAPWMALTETDPPRLVLDSHGIAEGGVRTPWVDVPVARTSGVVEDPNIMNMLFGSGEMFDAATIATLYPGGSADYLARFTDALDQAIASGFIVPADRQEILDLAAATYPGSD